MIYICCPSYATIFLALYLRDNGKEITILTHHEGIKKLCAHMEINHKSLSRSNTKLFWKDLLLEYKERKNLDKLFEEIDPGENDTLYFDSHVVEYKLFYLIKKWSRKGMIINTELINHKIDLYNFFKSSHPYGRRRYLKEIKSILIIFIIYGVRLKLYIINEHAVRFGFDEKFKERHKINIRDFGDYQNMVNNVIKNNLIKTKKYDTLIISSYPSKDIDYSIYNKFIREIPKLSSNIAIKTHPTLHHSNNIEENARTLFPEFDLIPSFIPVELILQNIRKNVIAESSTALIAASSIPHLKVICILDIVNWLGNKKRFAKHYRSILVKESKNRITFVKNISQLKSIIQ